MPWEESPPERAAGADFFTELLVVHRDPLPSARYTISTGAVRGSWCLQVHEASASLKGANLFLSTTSNRKIGLLFFIFDCGELQKGASFFFAYGELEKRCPAPKSAYGKKKGRKSRKMLRAQNRVLNQPRAGFLRKTAILTQMLRQRNSTTAQQLINVLHLYMGCLLYTSPSPRD